MKLAVIGDVHGCADEYNQLLNLIPDDFYIAQVGDLIHKGPYSSECVDLSRMFVDYQILGNHEVNQLRWFEHEATRGNKKNPMKQHVYYEECDLTEAQVSYLKSCPWFIPLNKVSLVHGGLPDSNYQFMNLQLIMIGSFTYQEVREVDKVKAAMPLGFTRYVNPAGRPVHYGQETYKDHFWAQSYRGDWGHIVFGHQPFERVERFKHATGIDTGCVYGGALTALLLEDGKQVDIIQVKAKKQYTEKEFL